MCERECILGGICGRSYSLVSACYNRGALTLVDENVDYPNCGGIVGRAPYNENSLCTIENCYSVGNVTVEKGNDVTNLRVGGVVGMTFENDILRNNFCYTEDGLKGIGEMYGEQSSKIEEVKVYTDKDELKDIAGKLGTDYKEDTKNINEGFPILAWQD